MSSFTFTEVVRLAQVGVTGWGRQRLRNLASIPSADLVVLSDPSDDALAAASRLSPLSRTTTGTDTVVADPAVDAVAIGTLEGAVAIAEACLEAGKHVLLDAPIAPTVDEARRLVALAEARGVCLMAGHVLRYHPAIERIEETVSQGELGTVRTIEWHLAGLRAPSATSVLDRLGPSALSVTQALVEDVPRRVTAHVQRYTSGGGEDVALVTVEYGNGCLAHLHLSRIDARKVRRLSVVGSKGLAAFDDQHPTEPVRFYGRDDEADGGAPLDYAHTGRVRSGDIRVPRVGSTEPLALECREFVSCIREHRAPLTNGADGLGVVRLLDAARRSVEAGGLPVAVS